MLNLAHDQFLNETVMPWDALSRKLAKPISVDPQSSTFIAEAGTVLTALRHAPERFKRSVKRDLMNTNVQAAFPQHQLVVDASDSWKHGKLTRPERQTTFSVCSHFLLDGGGRCRFLRNVVALNHPQFGQVDFLELTRQSIRFWLEREQISLEWVGVIFEGADIYRDDAMLTTAPGIQMMQRGARIRFFTIGSDGKLRRAPGAFAFKVVHDPTLLEHPPIPSSI